MYRAVTHQAVQALADTLKRWPQSLFVHPRSLIPKSTAEMRREKESRTFENATASHRLKFALYK